MHEDYGDLAQFFIVYIKEAHPADDWPIRVSERLKYVKDPENIFERFQVASTCVADLDISIPTLIDDMDNTAAIAYKAHPDRLYLVGKDGRIAFHGGPGPMGFKPKDLEQALKAELTKIGALTADASGEDASDD